jgi:glycosyltransferase involved in cell wall biosynthesis
MVSIVCAVKNRAKSLRVALSSWLVADGVDEIVIVDWDSTESLVSLAQLDPRIRIVRVNDRPNFHLAAAFNLAADVATGDTLLKLDADYVLNPFYPAVRGVLPPPGAFATGHFQHGGPFFAFLNGLLCVQRADWQRTFGYNENITDYGWDDDDFYNRLIAAELKRLIVRPQPISIFHIPHENDVRVQHYNTKNLEESHRRNRDVAPPTARQSRWHLTALDAQVSLAQAKS